MAIVKYWAQEAANEIGEALECWGNGKKEDARDIIAKHCPFEPDVAYMQVPRCDWCRHWTPMISFERHGECQLLRPGNYARNLGVDRLAIANANGEMAVFITQDRFGCVQWEAKS